MDKPWIPPAQTTGVNDLYVYNEFQFDSHSFDAGTLNAPQFILSKPLDGVIGVKLVSAEIPFTYYVITAVNNTFTLVDGGGTHTITIPVGNYTSNSISTALGTALTNGFATYTVTYSLTTGKLTVTSTVAEAFIVTFTSPNNNLPVPHGDTNPGYWLGFAQGSNTAVAGVLVAPNVLNITGPTHINVCGSIGGRIANTINVNGGSSFDPSSFGQVAVNTNPWGLITYQDASNPYFFDFGDGGYIQQISFYLSFGDMFKPLNLDLNGVGFSVTIGVLSKRTTSLTDAENTGADYRQGVSNKRQR